MMNVRYGRSARFAVLIGLSLLGAPVTAMAAETTAAPAANASALTSADGTSSQITVAQKDGAASSSQQTAAEDNSQKGQSATAAVQNEPEQKDVSTVVESNATSSGVTVSANERSAGAVDEDTESSAAKTSDTVSGGNEPKTAADVQDNTETADAAKENSTLSAAGAASSDRESQTVSIEENEAPADAAMIVASKAAVSSQASTNAPKISISVDVQGKGEMHASADQIAGTTGEGKLMDAVKVNISSPENGSTSIASDLEYRAHIQNDGWGSWTTAGNTVGAAGSGKRIEALQFRLRSGSALAAEWEIWSRAHVENQGWLAWTNDSPIGSTGHGLRLEAFEIKFEKKASATTAAASAAVSSLAVSASNMRATSASSQTDFPSDKDYPFIDGTQVEIQAHVQDTGWQGWVTDGNTAGTEHKSKRLEAIRFKVVDAYLTGDLEAQAHVQDIGWQGWKNSGSVAGTTGQGKRIEAIQFRLTGDLAKTYDVWYRANVQTIGWMGWTKDGSSAGTTGVAGRMEAMQVILLKKGSAAPTSSDQGTTLTFVSAPEIEYSAHVQNIGWQKKVSNDQVAGTTGQSKRIEAITMQLVEGDSSCPGGIEYRAHVQDAGWLNWVSDGATAGTTGQARRVEAFQVQLTGEIAKFFDVYYRAHVQNVGWQAWAKNGEIAGTTGRSLAVEAYRVKIALKTDDVPNTGIDYCWLASSPYWSGTVKQRIMNVHYSTGRYDEVTEVQHYIKQIVIHHNAGTLTTEGCWQTWQSRAASAHYQVEANGTVGQLVYDSNTAWHAGNWNENLDSIGIEHADAPGSSSRNWYLTEATINSGAKLVALLCMEYDLGRPQWGVNVVGHKDVSSTECPASLATGGSQHNEYMSKAQSWYDYFMKIKSA